MTMMWVGIGGIAVGAATSIYGANRAADAAGDAARLSTDAQLQMYNQSRADLAPYRQAGYGALDMISQLYGIPSGGGGTGASGSGTQYNVTSGGGGGGPSWANPLNALPGASLSPLGVFGHQDPISGAIGGLFGGSDQPKIYAGPNGLIYTDGRSGSDPRYAASINPATGEVSVGGRPEDSKLLTEYLRTGVVTPELQAIGGANGRTWAAIDQLRGQGWQYQPAAGQGTAGAPGAPATRDLSAFYTSPNYTFVRDEGMKGITNLASARGGIGGQALRQGAQFAGNLASGEFNNYVNRLASIAGLGQVATNTGVQAGMSTAGTLANIYTNAGNARGSSYLAGAAGVNNAIQGGLQNYAFLEYLKNRGSGGGGYQVPSDITNFQYPFGG